jgi:hypothetical protein
MKGVQALVLGSHYSLRKVLGLVAIHISHVDGMGKNKSIIVDVYYYYLRNHAVFTKFLV